MKKLITLVFFIPFIILAQNSAWSHLGEAQKVITKNEGHFNCSEAKSNIEFAFNSTNENFYFTKEGVIFEFQNKYKPVKSEEEKAWRKERKTEGFTKEEFDAFEQLGHRIVIEKDYLHTTWINANPNVQIIPSDKNEYYQSFSWDDNGQIVHKNFIPTYNKLTYKNIYNNIDIVYEMHPESGIKYTIVVHPGGNVNDIQLRYSKDVIPNIDGTLITKSMKGDIVDHRPISFYKNNEKQTIYSAYKLNNNIISFNIANYDKTKTLIIDPWTQTPNYNLGWDCVWECETDASGNTYTIGGIMPMVLNKYNSSGGLVWTYNTPYDTTSWLGTFATDNLGNSYVTLGSTAKIQKINTSGSVVWNNASPGGFFSSMEFWNIEFNCDQTKLIIGGTGGTLPPLPFIYNIDLNSGNITSSVQVTEGNLFPTQEVRSIASCGNGNYYFLSHDSIGYINQNLSLCSNSGSLFHTNSGFSLGYKCENWRVNNSGIEAMEFYDDFIYINRGNTLQKRKFSDASVVASVTIPGGTWSTSFGSSQVGTSGIAIDDCGNIYVGTTNGVLKYNQNLTLLTTYTTTNNFKVWDVEITSAGEVIAVGGTGTSSTNSRSGYVESITANACAQVAITCCDATMCPVGPLCDIDGSFTLTVATPGGVFAGVGITNAATGMFDPATAGIGTHQISYTLPCGSDTIEIVVNDCSAINVCKENNGDLTVSGGTPTYTWSQWIPASSVAITNSAQCTACGGSWVAFPGQCFNPFPIPLNNCTVPAHWTDFATGVTITPPVGVDSIRVTSGAGTEYFIYYIDTVSPCNTTCDATVDPAGPFCQNDAAVNLTATTPGGTWSGSGITNATAGTFDPSLSNPSNTITYTLPCGSSESITIITNANATYTDVQTTCISFTWTNGNGNTYTSSNNTATHTIVDGTNNGCDSVMTLDLTILPNETATDVQSACNSFTWIDGNTYTTSNNTATHVVSGQGGDCDTTYTLNLTILPNETATDVQSACNSFTWIDGNTYITSNNTATHTITGGAANGCDSILTLNLTIFNDIVTSSFSTSCNQADTGIFQTGPFTLTNGCDSTHIDTITLSTINSSNINVSICSGDSILLGGDYQTTAGTYYDTIPASGTGTLIDTFHFETFDGLLSWTLNTPTGVNGADNNFWTINDNEGGVTPGGSPGACGVGNNGNKTLHITSVFNPSGGAAYDAGGLCGILFCPQTNMAATSNNISTIGKISITLGFDFIGNGEGLNDNASLLYSTNGGTSFTSLAPSLKSTICGSGQGLWTHTSYTLPAAAENIANLQIRFNWTNNDDGAGTDPSVAINNMYLTSQTSSSTSCDSLVISNLSFLPFSNGTDVISACGSFTWIDGNTYTNSNNTATHTIVGGASNGCDSIVTLNLTIGSTVNATDNQTACGSYTWIDGNTYTSSNNTATFTIAGQGGACDTLATLNLTINNTVNGVDMKTACNTYTWIDGNTYTASNTTATHTIVGGAANGCDSIVTLNLTIGSTVNTTDIQTACGSYTWIDGNTYTSSNNTATFTIAGQGGACDTLATLNLTINNNTTGIDTKTACGSYTWIDGNTYTNSNNTATHTIVGGASNGCDSIVTLNLTIGSTVNTTDNQTACGSYTWIDGNTYTSSNNTATFTIVGQGGACDTLVTLNLTINNSVSGTDLISACNMYTWIDGNTYTSSNNTATHTIVGGAANGCDSIVTLNLIVNHNIDSTFSVSACNSFTWINGTTYTNSNNSDTFVIVGVGGACDIIVHLNLAINTPTSINLGNDTTIYQGVSIELNASNQGNLNGTYDWNPNNFINCIDCINPIVTPLEDIVYTLIFTNEFGCVSTDDIAVLLRYEDHYCYFPTAFTPNQDNVNDIYRSICKNVETVDLRIYNRWGGLIYSGDVADGFSGWDGIFNGKEQSVDVYTYYAKIKYLNGDTENVSGNFTLIR